MLKDLPNLSANAACPLTTLPWVSWVIRLFLQGVGLGSSCWGVTTRSLPHPSILAHRTTPCTHPCSPSSPSIAVKAALLIFPNRSRFSLGYSSMVIRCYFRPTATRTYWSTSSRTVAHRCRRWNETKTGLGAAYVLLVMSYNGLRRSSENHGWQGIYFICGLSSGLVFSISLNKSISRSLSCSKSRPRHSTRIRWSHRLTRIASGSIVGYSSKKVTWNPYYYYYYYYYYFIMRREICIADLCTRLF